MCNRARPSSPRSQGPCGILFHSWFASARGNLLRACVHPAGTEPIMILHRICNTTLKFTFSSFPLNDSFLLRFTTHGAVVCICRFLAGCYLYAQERAALNRCRCRRRRPALAPSLTRTRPKPAPVYETMLGATAAVPVGSRAGGRLTRRSTPAPVSLGLGRFCGSPSAALAARRLMVGAAASHNAQNQKSHLLLPNMDTQRQPLLLSCHHRGPNSVL